MKILKPESLSRLLGGTQGETIRPYTRCTYVNRDVSKSSAVVTEGFRQTPNDPPKDRPVNDEPTTTLNLEEIAASGETKEEENLEKVKEIVGDLSARAFNVHMMPPEEPPVAKLNGVKIATPGNLVVISGQAASAKSHSAAAMLASAMTPARCDLDFLGWDVTNEEGKAVVYLDCEMSPVQFDSLVRNALKRAGISEPPPWFHAYNLTGKEPHEIRRDLEALLRFFSREYYGIRFAFIDGFADMVQSPNDEAECFEMVRWLHDLAIEHKAPIFGVLHQNAGSESLKMRGHLGSQLERKAETVLTLKRDEGSIEAYTLKARHAGILKGKGPRFEWDNTEDMFMSVESKSIIKQRQEAEEQKELVRRIFHDSNSLTYTAVCNQIMELENLKIDAAKKRIRKLRAENYLEHDVVKQRYTMGGKVHE